MIIRVALQCTGKHAFLLQFLEHLLLCFLLPTLFNKSNLERKELTRVTWVTGDWGWGNHFIALPGGAIYKLSETDHENF